MSEARAGSVAQWSEVDELLEMLATWWTVHLFGDRASPHTIAGVHPWPDRADVVVLWGEDAAIAYRTPSGPDVDIFAPSHVYWWYAAKTVWVLRAALTLAAPGQAGAPELLVDSPPSFRIPEQNRRPVHIRPPRSRDRLRR